MCVENDRKDFPLLSPLAKASIILPMKITSLMDKLPIICEKLACTRINMNKVG